MIDVDRLCKDRFYKDRMLDHLGFPVADYARSKAFYARALAPLGYTLIAELGAEQTESGSLEPDGHNLEAVCHSAG